MFCIQHCFICRPSDSTVSEDAGIEPRTVAIPALAVSLGVHIQYYKSRFPCKGFRHRVHRVETATFWRTVHRDIFCFCFFSFISSLPAPEYPIKTVSNTQGLGGNWFMKEKPDVENLVTLSLKCCTLYNAHCTGSRPPQTWPHPLRQNTVDSLKEKQLGKCCEERSETALHCTLFPVQIFLSYFKAWSPAM